MRKLALLGALCLVSCAHIHQKRLQDFVGKSEPDLVSAKGIPNRTATMMNGVVVYEYADVKTDQLEMSNSTFRGVKHHFSDVRTCIDRCFITNGVVTRADSEGNNCGPYN